MSLDDVANGIRGLVAAGVAREAILAVVREALDGSAGPTAMNLAKCTGAELRALARVGTVAEYRQTLAAISLKREMTGGAR